MSQLIRISNEDYGIIIFPVTGREYNPRLDSDVNIKGSLYSRSLWPGIQYPRVAVNIMHVWTLILISNDDYGIIIFPVNTARNIMTVWALILISNGDHGIAIFPVTLVGNIIPLICDTDIKRGLVYSRSIWPGL